jgi:hypothetical protein
MRRCFRRIATCDASERRRDAEALGLDRQARGDPGGRDNLSWIRRCAKRGVTLGQHPTIGV